MPNLPLKVGAVYSFSELGGSKYVVADELHGGMGIVYKLIPVDPTDPPMALKSLQPSADLHAFLRECKIWIAASKHPNTAKLYWYGQYGDLPVVLAEWYPATLSDVMLSEWSDDQIISLIVGIVEALRYANEEFNLVHQDIKPANILISHDRHPKIADFGLARFSPVSVSHRFSLAKSRVSPDMTVSYGPFGGTLAYMAPELLKGGTGPSVFTDMYSLGVTLYASLVGTHPFIRNNRYFLSPLHVDFQPLIVTLAARSPSLSFVINLVRSLMNPDPGQRPSSYQAILDTIPNASLPKIESQDQLNALVAQARFRRSTGDSDGARYLLLDALAERPNHPVLLNALGMLYASLGDEQAALRALEQAYRQLKAFHGQTGTNLYLDPVINLARHLVSSGSYYQAFEVLQEAWVWRELKRNSLEYFRSDYWEFGWMHLYSGDHDLAMEYGLSLSRAKVPDTFALQWLTLASFFSGTVLPLSRITSWLNYLRPLSPTNALALCLAVHGQPREQSFEILEAVNQDAAEQIYVIETDLGAPRYSLRPPVHREIIRTLVKLLDHNLTGGRNSEYL